MHLNGAFKSDSTIALMGNAVYALAQLGVLVVLARLTSTEDVGRYALALAIAAPIQIGLGMRLRTARVVNDPKMFPLGSYLFLGIVMAVTASIVSTVVGIVSLSDERTVVTVVLIALSKATESLIDVSYGELQRCGRMAEISKSQIIRAILTLSAVSLGAWLEDGIIGAAVALNVAWMVQFLAFDIHRMRASSGAQPQISNKRRLSLRLAQCAWPLGLAAAMTSFNTASPRYIISGLLSTSDVGIFAILSYPTTIVALFANSLGQANLIHMSNAVRQRDLRKVARIVISMSSVIFILGLIATTFLLIIGKKGITVVFGSEYGNEFTVCVILMLVATVAGLATVSYYALVCTGKFTRQPIIIGLVSAVGVPTVLAMTNAYGLIGTAWGMMIMLGVQCILMSVMAFTRLWRI